MVHVRNNIIIRKNPFTGHRYVENLPRVSDINMLDVYNLLVIILYYYSEYSSIENNLKCYNVTIINIIVDVFYCFYIVSK